MAVFNPQTYLASEQLKLEKRKFDEETSPYSTFLKTFGNPGTQQFLGVLGSLAVDQARYHLTGGKEKLALEGRAQDTREGQLEVSRGTLDLGKRAEERLQKGQDIEAFGMFREGSEAQQKAGEGLGFFDPKKQPAPTPNVKQFPDGTYGLEVNGDAADFSADDGKGYQLITKEEFDRIKDPSITEDSVQKPPVDYYVKQQLNSRNLTGMEEVSLRETQKEILTAAETAKQKDVAASVKEIENYTKTLDSTLLAGGALQSPEGRKNIAREAKEFAAKMERNYPGLKLDAQLQPLKTLDATVLNEKTIKNLQKHLRRSGAQLKDARTGQSNTQYVKNLNQSEEKKVQQVLENQKAIDAEFSVLSKFRQNNAEFLNKDGSVNVEAYNSAPPGKQKAIENYAKRRNKVEDLQKQNNGLVSPKTAKRLGLIQVTDDNGRKRWLIGSKSIEGIADDANKSVTAVELIAGDEASYKAVVDKRTEKQIVSIIASMNPDVNEDGVKSAITSRGTTARDELNSLYKENPEAVATAISNYAGTANESLIGIESSKRATNVNQSSLEKALNDKTTIEAVIAKKAKESKVKRAFARDHYDRNPEELRNDVALYDQDPKASFAITIEDRTDAANTLVKQINTSKASYGETPTEQRQGLEDALSLTTDKQKAALKAAYEGKIRTAAQNALLGDAFLNLDPNHPLKTAMGSESDEAQKLLKHLNLTEEEIKQINKGVEEGNEDAVDSLYIIKNKK